MSFITGHEQILPETQPIAIHAMACQTHLITGFAHSTVDSSSSGMSVTIDLIIELLSTVQAGDCPKAN